MTFRIGRPAAEGRARARGADAGREAAHARANDRPPPPSRVPGAVRATALASLLAVAAACGGEDAGAGRGGDGSAEAPASEAPSTARQEADSAGAPGRAEGGGRELTTLDVAGHDVKVEIADDEDEREQGLMHRDSLPPDQGMLFVYPEEQTLSFYMRNTEIPLDIAYIDQRGFIVDVQQMEPHSEELHESRRPAMYALEMNRGWFEVHGVGEGDRVRF